MSVQDLFWELFSQQATPGLLSIQPPPQPLNTRAAANGLHQLPRRPMLRATAAAGPWEVASVDCGLAADHGPARHDREQPTTAIYPGGPLAWTQLQSMLVLRKDSTMRPGSDARCTPAVPGFGLQYLRVSDGAHSRRGMHHLISRMAVGERCGMAHRSWFGCTLRRRNASFAAPLDSVTR
jgi:hypothetical protein